MVYQLEACLWVEGCNSSIGKFDRPMWNKQLHAHYSFFIYCQPPNPCAPISSPDLGSDFLPPSFLFFFFFAICTYNAQVHQNYYAKNPLSPYCMMNVGTKLVKLSPDISRINKLAREREQNA